MPHTVNGKHVRAGLVHSALAGWGIYVLFGRNSVVLSFHFDTCQQNSVKNVELIIKSSYFFML